MGDVRQVKRGASLELSSLHGGEVVYQPGDVLGPRVLYDFEIVFIVEGNAVYESDGKAYSLEPGSFAIGRPGFVETYRWDKEQCTRHAFVHFDITQYPADWPDPADWPRTINKPAALCVRSFQHILQHIYEYGIGSGVSPSPMDCRLLSVLIDALLEPQHEKVVSLERDRPEPVRRALMYIRRVIEEKPDYPLSLYELASEANVTEKHLCRLFAKWVGYSPIQTYTLLRLESAVGLLSRTNLSIKEVACRCGFNNALYFSRIFARAYGFPPSVFRAKLKKGQMRIRTLLPVDLVPRILL